MTDNTNEITVEEKKTKKRTKTSRKVRWNVLKHISVVYTELKMSHFLPRLENREFLKSVENICDYLGLNDAQVFIFCALFGMYFELSERPVTFFNISDSCDCNPLVLLSIRDELDGILDKGYITECDPPDDSIGRSFYRIPEYVVRAVLDNRTIDVEAEIAKFNMRDFLADVGRMIDNRIDNKLSCDSLFSKIERLERRYKVKEIEHIREYLPDIADRSMLYDIAFGLVICNNPDLRSFVLINRNTDVSTREAVSTAIVDETHQLFRKDLVQFEVKGTIQDSTISLTDKAYSIVFGAEGSSFQARKTDRNIVHFSAIKEKPLFYSKDTEKEIKRLFDSADEKRFSKIQERLSENGLSKGVCVLFYGEPGTGKTESVYQMAKKSERDIFRVDISSMKSEWHGEAEQKTKKLFETYSKMCENARKAGERIPILLFNEADGVIGKRKQDAERSVDKMENSVQNIILQEMESLEGIMIATTNLVQNIDAAFERRFLYKIKFDKPELAQRVRIWQSLMPAISGNTANILASNYDFSGGQIENIARKCDVDSILYGTDVVNEDRIIQYCADECIVKGEKPKIGFV